MTPREAITYALACRSREQAWELRELADALGLSHSTVHWVLQDLAEKQLAVQAAGGGYQAGQRLRVLARWVHQSHPLPAGAARVADELARRRQDARVRLRSGPQRVLRGPVRCRARAGPLPP
ncbi:helix-turn-helix domain-containing protein [Streptomyces flaveolus]|uniref:helix-turn-helix domain-containing protein n=1 Tax=Streptomyces flaveolus TaxID=67297 RepID=UPI0037F63B6C